jgi:hypothetical protein
VPKLAASALRWWAPLWWAGLVMLVIALSLVFWGASPMQAVNVDLLTERLEVHPPEGRELRWNVSGYRLWACESRGGEPKERELAEDTELRIAGEVIMVVTKLQGIPEFRVDLRSTRGAATPTPICDGRLGALTLIEPDGNRRWIHGDSAALVYRHRLANSAKVAGPTAARVLELRGAVRAGQNPGPAAETQLLSGQVSVHSTAPRRWSSAWLDALGVESTYLSESRPLQRGDQLEVLAPEGTAALAWGSMRMSAKGAIEASYIAPAAQARIHRLGAEPIAVAPSPWRRFQNEPALTGLVVLFVLWLNVAQIMSIFVNAGVKPTLPMVRRAKRGSSVGP